MKKLQFPSLLTAALMFPRSVYAAATDDVTRPLGRLLELLYAVLSGVGAIILAYNIFQLAISIRSHDPSQRSNALLGVVSGIVILLIPSIVRFIQG